MLSANVDRCPGLLAAASLFPVQPCVDCRRRLAPSAGPWQTHMQPLAWQPAAGDWRCVKRLAPVPAAAACLEG